MKRTSSAETGTAPSGTLVLVASIALLGCSLFTPEVDVVGSGGLGFTDRQVPRDTEYISIGTPGHKQYRVFNSHGAGSTLPMRAEAEQTAHVFCERKGREINLLQITTFRPEDDPWFVDALAVLCLQCLGGPRSAVEIFFECLEKRDGSGSLTRVDAR